MTQGDIVFGRYRIEEKIGEGGYGVVYRAMCLTTQQSRAIKFSRSTSCIADLKHEYAVLSKLEHHSIVSAVEYIAINDETSGIVMDFVEGESLDKLAAEQRIPLEAKTGILQQIAVALSYIHCQNIIFRDIKPHNVLVTPNMHVKMIDFGIALLTEGDKAATTPVNKFTEQYMSPEQVSDEGVDNKSDIYSFGALAFELLTGQPLFKDEEPDRFKLYASHKVREAPLVRDYSKAIPKWLELCVDICLQKDPSQRYESFDDIARIFEHHKKGSTIVKRISGWFKDSH